LPHTGHIGESLNPILFRFTLMSGDEAIGSNVIFKRMTGTMAVDLKNNFQ